MNNEQIHQELYTYLLKCFGKQEKIVELLRNKGMKFFYPNISSDQNVREILLKKISFSKYKAAMTQINKRFAENGIDFVVMKGITLAMDIYGDKPYMRTFGDIDILILPDQLTDVLATVESMGYKFEEDFSMREFFSDINREHHLPPLIRGSDFFDGVMLELHLDIVPLWIFQTKQHYTDRIIKRSHKNEFSIPVMDDYDSIVFMMLHLIKHFVYELCMGFIFGKIKVEFDLRSLHEIALFVNKRRKSLSKDILEERACEYGAGSELRFVCDVLRDIYPSLDEILDIHPSEQQRGCFACRFCQEAIKMRSERVLFGDRRELVEDIISKLQRDAFILQCYMKEGEKGRLRTREIEIASGCFQGDNRFGTYMDVQGEHKTVGCRGRFSLEWDKEYLWFYMTIKSSKFSFLDCDHETGKQVMGYQDFYRLNFDTGNRNVGKAFVRGIVLKPQYVGDGKLKLFVKEDIMGNCGETVLEETEYDSSALCENGVCNFKVGLPWDRLGYKPREGFSFYFDVQIWEYHEEEKEHISLSWQDAYKPWYDITTYAHVELVK